MIKAVCSLSLWCFLGLIFILTDFINVSLQRGNDTFLVSVRTKSKNENFQMRANVLLLVPFQYQLQYFSAASSGHRFLWQRGP